MLETLSISICAQRCESNKSANKSITKRLHRVFFFVAVPLHSSQTYSLQVYSLFMYKHSLQRNEVDLQAISVCCLIAFGLNGMLVNRKRETDLDFFVCCLFPMQGKTL